MVFLMMSDFFKFSFFRNFEKKIRVAKKKCLRFKSDRIKKSGFSCFFSEISWENVGNRYLTKSRLLELLGSEKYVSRTAWKRRSIGKPILIIRFVSWRSKVSPPGVFTFRKKNQFFYVFSAKFHEKTLEIDF